MQQSQHRSRETVSLQESYLGERSRRERAQKPGYFRERQEHSPK